MVSYKDMSVDATKPGVSKVDVCGYIAPIGVAGMQHVSDPALKRTTKPGLVIGKSSDHKRQQKTWADNQHAC